jgi:pilus assembly protein CpaE
VAAEVNDYPRSKSDSSVRKFLTVRPDVIFIQAEDAVLAEEAIRVLHAALPAAWILVCTSATEAKVIMELVRAGARELLPYPVEQDSLMQALRRCVDDRDQEINNEPRVRGKLYAVCAGKRGSGSTTIAINLAASLAETPNSRVALVDLDWPLGDAAAYLNVGPRFTVSNALSSADRLDAVLLESYMHKHENLHVLAGLEDFEPDDALTPQALSQVLDLLAQSYTHTVIDMPVSLNRTVLQTVTAMSANVLMVITPDLPSLRRTERLLRFIGGLEGPDKIRLVLNRSRKSDEITENDIAKALNHSVSWKISNDYYACMEAISSGKPVLATSGKGLAKDFREMSRQLIGGETETKRKGLLNLMPKASTSFFSYFG